MKLHNNFVADTDYYKFTHHLGYKRGTSNIYSYGEPRVGARFDHILFFGLQPILMDYMAGEVVTADRIGEARRKNFAWSGYDSYFNIEMWETILTKYKGRLPLRIKAVREGTKVPISNILFSIELLDKDKILVPLVNHTETYLSHIWYTSTICTNSYEIKKDIYKALKESGTPEHIEYLCHDFGMRGGTCPEQVMRGGMAHLVNFRGSDTTNADRGIDCYYGYSEPSRLKSVFATEHSVAETFGPGEGEYEYLKHILSVAPDDAIASVVIDTYDPLNFIDNVATRSDIKEMILNRKGKIVFRPDTGNPEEMTNRILNSLANSFGYSYNHKHYKVLNPRIGLIYGDGMEKATIKSLYQSILANKWSADNLVVGSGGGLLQKFDRDTMRFAIKASHAIIDDKEVNLIKKPAAQMDKKSKTGRLKLSPASGGGRGFITLSSAEVSPEIFDSYMDSLETVFEMGEVVRMQTFDEIIKITGKHFKQDTRQLEFA